MSAARIAIDRLLRARWRSRIALADIDGFADVSPGWRELHSRFVRHRSWHHRSRRARHSPIAALSGAERVDTRAR